MADNPSSNPEALTAETREWLDSLDSVLAAAGPERVQQLITELSIHAHNAGVALPFTANTPYINTIHARSELPYPGNQEIEQRLRSIIRWNAMAMVVRANRDHDGIGGHISSYASSATLLEVAFNHFLRGRTDQHPGDLVYFQGHSSPGIYARAFLEGRISEAQMIHFRRETAGRGVGLSSYPHPWLMPGFWQFPTVSMGLGPIAAIYQARFMRYLEDRGLLPKSDAKVWAFLGDGETDEPESLGAITLPAREKLDNLIFVINCNLQRLDGPVRGNGKIIQELEAAFRGAGWNVIKVIWGRAWDPLLASPQNNRLIKRMADVVDGQYQKYTVEGGAYIRKHFFGADPELHRLVAGYSDEELRRLNRGGHDPTKVYNAFRAAMQHTGTPTVVLAKTIKGYGLGESGEGKNISHQQKKLNEEELKNFRNRFGIPISDEDVADAPFYKPDESSPVLKYLHERRAALGGHVPERRVWAKPHQMPDAKLFDEAKAGSGDRPASTTMAFVRLLSKLLKDPKLGKYIVPIVPDEARTFGMEALFRQSGIYSHAGQLYEPVDKENLLYYKEATDGQILEEGITEAGSLSSFIAAGTAHATYGIPMIPVFMFYSMFGLQRVGDLIWAAGDSRARGFLCGATAGRTTLAGEGLQHQDGHSHLLAYPVPNLLAYDPAYAYEIATIVEDGMRRMYVDGEDIFYYITLMNENYVQPAMPDGVRDGILRGMYRLRPAPQGKHKYRAQLLGSGAILNEALLAQEVLAADYGVGADVWSVTSYKELHRDALQAERRALLGDDATPSYLATLLADVPGPFVAASDYVRALPESIARFLPGRLLTLGTDGFGRSDTRAALRDFFEVDHRYIVVAALHALAAEGAVDTAIVARARRAFNIDANKPNPWTA